MDEAWHDVDMPVADERSVNCAGIEGKAADTVGKASSGSSGHSHSETLVDNQEAAAELADWLAEMELTSPKFLRATPVYCITAGAGRALRTSYNSALVSQEVEFIRKFVSHSWQSRPFWKTLSFPAIQ
ncbi:unnamed protein product [Effrenium voratum]|nr:unnamed protein product [Effrenium voratum]